ncbi:MAG: DNA-binding NarL/FixJ family response regulator [Maribacter sp.]|jgi:DNA-binding NarL/FixJ family response regulator
MKIRLGMIEDDSVILNGFYRYLSSLEDIDFIITADSVEEFRKRSENIEIPLDVILSDIGLPGESGIEGIKEYKEKWPDCNVIMITIFKDDDKIFGSFCAGATGYLLKNTPLSIVAESIRKISNGDVPMSPSIARRVIQHFKPKKPTRFKAITPREQEIVNALVDGLSYKMIAKKLQISYETVKQHIKNIYKKLQVNSKAEVIARSLKRQ